MKSWHWDLWVLFGMVGQMVFGSRFVIQWIASERRKSSYIPPVFWWLSVIGGIITLTYAIHKHDPVFTIAQSIGLLVYVRNLMLIYSHRSQAEPHADERPAPPPSPDRP